MFRTTLATAIALAVTSPLAFAQDATQQDELERVVVTGTRTAITVDDSLAAVEVIDRKDIERTQARSLPELLRGRAGINLVNQGGAGKLSTLFMRGAESDHVLFLVDGVRVGSSTSGLTAIQDIPVELIDRVEIVRGPRSSLYGSDAIGGVIQVFTRKTRDGVRPRVHAGVGSDNERELSAGIDFGYERAWFGADYSHQETDGFQSCLGYAVDPVYAGCFVNNPDPDRDDYESNAISLRAGLRPVDGLVLEANALRNEGRNAFDGDPTFIGDVSDTTQQLVGGKAKWDVGRVTLTLSGGRNLDNSVQTLDGEFMDFFESRRTSASLQGDFRVADGHVLTAGYDWQDDEGNVRDRFETQPTWQRWNRAVFAQYVGEFGKQDLQASVRRDDNEQFGGNTTGGLAWGMSLAHDFRVTASVGTAFKAPTFNELYFPFYGNPALLPEESETWELGIGQQKTDWRWALNAFETRVDDLIVYDIDLFMANNLEEARIRGAELTGSLTIAEWNISGAASWVDPRNRSATFDDNLLPRRAQTTGRIDVDRAFGDFSVGATVIGEGDRYDDVANTLRVGGFSTLDLRAEWRVAPEWTLQARVGNVFDHDYQTAAYYAQPGRQWFLSVRYAAQ